MKSIHDYELEIKELYQILQDYPDNISLQEKLSRRLSKWVKLLDIIVYRANNEQDGWDESEIKLPIKPMPTKEINGFNQVADYQFYINDYKKWGGVIIERKGVTRNSGRMVSSDLYSSFAKKDNRRRFEAEFKRYQKDPRFNLFVLIAECSYGEYLSFKPAFNGKNYNKTNFGMSVAARRATIAKLISMGIVVHFSGTRLAAVELYSDLVRQWCRVHYKQVLNIEGI